MSTTDPQAQQTGPSFLERLRGFALRVEERITPSEVQDVLSAVVSLLDHHGLNIPEPEPEPDPQATEVEQKQHQKITELEAELARLRGAPAPGASGPAAPAGPLPASPPEGTAAPVTATDPTTPQP